MHVYTYTRLFTWINLTNKIIQKKKLTNKIMKYKLWIRVPSQDI